VKRLADRRVLLVGASSGIGRATASALGSEGARVALTARRADRLGEVAQEVPGGALVLPCDVRDPVACESVVAQAGEGLGGLDALVYVAGVPEFRYLREAGAEDWRRSLETNLVGAALMTRAALAPLAESQGRAVYVSSIAPYDHPPRRGLGLYITSKAALDTMVAVWQAEHHDIAFTCVNVGDTGATEMGVHWDQERGGDQIREWIQQGVMFGRAMKPESVGRHLVDLLAAEEAIPVSSIVPRFGNGDWP
jgi:NAD(P)-dependent dehydrogenase (short-subunit alcohol dehydrogenase family)